MKRQGGFTLVELMVTLVVLAIMAGVALPGFQTLVARNNMVAAANGVVGAISYARSEALRERGGARLQTVDSTDADNEWGPGWRVVTVRSNGGATTTTILREFTSLASDLTLNGPDGVTEIAFTSGGALSTTSATQLDLCLVSRQEGVRITIAPTGRPSTSSLTTECS